MMKTATNANWVIKQYFYGVSKKLKRTNHINDNFTNDFDSLNGTELKVSLDHRFSATKGFDSMTMM